MSEQIKEARLFDGCIILKDEKEAYYQLIDSLECVLSRLDDDEDHRPFAQALFGEAMARAALEDELAEVSRKQAQAEQDAWDKGWEEGCHEGGKHAMQRVQEVEAELAEARDVASRAVDKQCALRAEIESLEARLLDADNTARIQIERAEDLQAEIERKDAALRRYGQHDDDCHFWDARNPRSCTCGLDAALSSGEGEEARQTTASVRPCGGPESSETSPQGSTSSPTLSREATRLEIHLLEEVLSEVIASMTESMDAAQRPKGSGYCDIRPYTVNEWRHSLVAILDAAQEEK